MKRLSPLVPFRVLACLGVLIPTATATTINYAGKEQGNQVRNWSNPAVPKSWDLNGDNRFGGAGYYQIMPAAIGTDNVGLIADAGNDLGVTEDISGAPGGALQTVGLTPDFLTGIPTGAAGDFINNTNFPNYSDAAGTTQLRQGSIWLLESNIQEGGEGVPGNANTAFSFTLSKAAEFRLGVAVDAMDYSDAAPDYVSIWNANKGEVFSGLLSRDGVSDMVFFDIAGGEGEEFVVKLWTFDYTRTAFALITFDQVPTPTLAYTQDGGNFTLSWEQEIPGWILESSTDLGVEDDWAPVPGVVNNSVTLDMTGTPKNFFRLRKNP